MTISFKNSWKSIDPLLSTSTALTISYKSPSEIFYPVKLFITVPSSLVVIDPSPSLSNNVKPSLYSAIYSGVNLSVIYKFIS